MVRLCRSASRSANARCVAARSVIHWPISPGGSAVGQGELVALGFGGGVGFGGAERGVVLIGVAAAEFGVSGDGQVALGAGGGVPVSAVGHDRGEHCLALPVGLVQGLVAGREFLLAGGGVVVAVLFGGGGFGTCAQAGQAGLEGGGADLAELVPDLLRCPGGLDRVGVAQVQSVPSGMPRTSGPSAGPRAARASCQAARMSGAAATGSGPIGSAGSPWPDSSR